MVIDARTNLQHPESYLPCKFTCISASNIPIPCKFTPCHYHAETIFNKCFSSINPIINLFIQLNTNFSWHNAPIISEYNKTKCASYLNSNQQITPLLNSERCNDFLTCAKAILNRRILSTLKFSSAFSHSIQHYNRSGYSKYKNAYP